MKFNHSNKNLKPFKYLPKAHKALSIILLDFSVLLLKDLKIEDRVDHYEINDRILAQLYKNAIAFIFPSLYEGFGIPVLEGFKCKCPAVLSNSSSLSEIAGEAAVYFDPEDRDSIEEAVKRVVYDADLRKKMIEKGSERVKDFSWRKTAEQTCQRDEPRRLFW